MRRNICRRSIAWTLIALIALCTTAVADGMKKRKKRVLVETHRLVYGVEMNEREVGRETIVRRVYNDNTVEFNVEISAQYGPAVQHDQYTSLVLEEESYFPRSFYAKKDIKTSGDEISHEVNIEMYANVASVNTRIASTTEDRNIVLPTGTAFFEVGALYPLYQLLFWYDEELGGRQSFYTFDVQQRKEGTVVLNQTGREIVSTPQGDVDTSVIEFTRDEYNVRLNVDEHGRIVRAQQAVTSYELLEAAVE